MKNFTIYAYHPPMKGMYEHDRIKPERYLAKKEFYDSKYLVQYNEERGTYSLFDVVYEEDGKTVKDFRIAEHFKNQRDCGMNVLFLQKNAVGYAGEPFETSEMKKVLDEAYAGGFDKIILCDDRLHALSTKTSPLIGEGCPFTDENALVEYCKECIAPYKAHPAFYGVYLLDEPTWKTLPQVSATYRALKKAKADIFVQTNLLPMAGDAEAVTGQGKTSASLFVDVSLPENQGITLAQAYRKYLETSVLLAGADNITMDSYPIREGGPYKDSGNYGNPDWYKEGGVDKEEPNYYLLPLHFATLQILAETGKKYGIPIGGVSNSCSMTKVRDDEDKKLVASHKAPDGQDIRYQVNAYMAFGAKIFSYYIYWARRDNAPGCYHEDTVITRKGEKTPLYYQMQTIHEEMQRLATTLCDYEYEAATYVGNFAGAKYFVKNELALVKDIELIKGEGAIVTQLGNEKGGKLYGIVNPSIPSIEGADRSIALSLRINGEATLLCHNGEKALPVQEGKVYVSLPYGEAAFILVK